MRIVFVFIVLTLFSCELSRSQIEPDEVPKIVEEEMLETIFLVDECSSNKYTALLEENKRMGKDSCQLIIEYLDGHPQKNIAMRLPSDRVSIKYCNDNYVVLEYSCGGACYCQTFVFLDSEKKPKEFYYSQQIVNASNMIAHIRNEEFGSLVVYNFENGEEVTIDIPGVSTSSYGRMDSIYFTKKQLNLKYTLENKRVIRKTVDITLLLKL